MRATVIGIPSFLLVLASCGGESTNPAGPPIAIEFTGSDTVLVDEGQSIARPTATALDASGRPTSAKITYSVTGTTARLVDGASIEGLGPGLSTLHAYAGSLQATLPVGVIGHPSAATGTLLAIGQNPWGVAAAGTTVIASQIGTPQLTVLDSHEDATVLSTIPLTGAPIGISLTPDAKLAFVANESAFGFELVDLASGVRDTLYDVGTEAFRTLTSHDGARAYGGTSDLGLGAGRIIGIDVASRQVHFTTSVPHAVNGLAIDATDDRLYASSPEGDVYVLDARSGALLGTITLPGILQEILVSPDGGSLLVADESRGVYELALPSGQVSMTVDLDRAFGMAITPDGKELWVSQGDLGQVTVLDPATGAVLRTITGLAGPRRLAFDRFGVGFVAELSGGVRVFR